MQHVLIHIDVDMGLGPIGAWSYHNERLVHFYPDSLDVQIAARAREVMALRDLDIPVPDWFAFLAGQMPTAYDEYNTLIVETPLTLPSILADFRRHWYADVGIPSD